MGVFGDVEDALSHIAAFPYADDPPEVIFENFDLVIGQTDRSGFVKT